MPRSRFVLSTCLVSVLALVSLGAREAGAIQIVPSIGISQTPDGENRTMMAVALRNGFLPRTQMEFQAGYRTEEMELAGESFEMKTVPLTLSLWASPIPLLYAGAGVGAYLQGIEYENNLYPASNEVQFGTHVGGGMHFSVAAVVFVNLQGRYVFMNKTSTEVPSGEIDPSFWSLSAGLAIGF